MYNHAFKNSTDDNSTVLLTSVNSHITLMAHNMPKCRTNIALNIQPKKCPQANTSRWLQILSIEISEQLTPYSCK